MASCPNFADQRLYRVAAGESPSALTPAVDLRYADGVVDRRRTDNRFFEPVGRFPAIEEDEAPLHLLVNDYGRYYRYCR